MNDFSMFRVADWLESGCLLKRLETIVDDVVEAASSIARAGVVASAAAIVSVPAHASDVGWTPNAIAQASALYAEPAEARVSRLDAQMERTIAGFYSSDQSDLDPRLVDAAEQMLKVVPFPTLPR